MALTLVQKKNKLMVAEMLDSDDEEVVVVSLDSRKRTKNERRSRYIFSPFEHKGKYASVLPDTAEADEFFKTYKEAYAGGETQRFSEKQDPACSGLMLDFDMFHPTPDIQIKPTHIKLLVQRVADVIGKMFVFGDEDDTFEQEYRCAVIRKPFAVDPSNVDKVLLNYSEKHKKHKDGLHLLLSEIQTTKSVKRMLIKELNEMGWDDVFPGVVFANEKDDPILDTNSAHVPVFLLGSVKPGKTETYPLDSMWLVETLDGKSDVRRFSRKEMRKAQSGNLPMELSLTNWGNEGLTNKQERVLTDAYAEKLLQIEATKKEADEKGAKFAPDEEEIERVRGKSGEAVEIIRDITIFLDPERADNTKKWRCVLSVLRNLEDVYGLDLWEVAFEFSKQSDNFKSEDDVRSHWEKVRKFGYMGLLWHWLKEDNSGCFNPCYRQWMELFPKKKSCEDAENYEDLDLFNNETVELEQVLRWMKKCIFELKRGGKSVFITKNKAHGRYEGYVEEYDKLELIKKNDLASSLDKFCNVINKDYIPVADRTDEQKAEAKACGKTNAPLFARKYLFTSLGGVWGVFLWAVRKGVLKSYNDIEFYPYLKRLGKPPMFKDFNTFGGFPLEDYEPTEVMDYKNSATRAHIRDALCGGRLDEFDHLEKCMADMIQVPQRRTGVSHCFASEQGLLKDKVATFWAAVIGNMHAKKFNDEEAYFKSFNAEQANKIHVLLNEVSDNGASRKNHNKLKGEITRETVRIEPKGVDAYELTHSARYWFFTNNERAFYVEDSDRRMTLHKCDSTHANDWDHFAPIVAEMKNRDFQKAAFEFYAEMQYEEREVLSAFHSTYKDEQKLTNIPNPLKFIIALLKGEVEEKGDVDVVGKGNDKVLKFTYKGLYKTYKDYCEETNLKAFSMDSFKDTLKRIQLGPYKTVRFGSMRRMGYRVPLSDIVVSFRKILKMPTFDPIPVVVEEDDEESDEDSD